MTRRKRLDTLEAARRKWQAEHIPLREVPAYLRYMLGVIAEEAGSEAADRVAVRTVPLLEALLSRAGVQL